jgi:hypothetical protein
MDLGEFAFSIEFSRCSGTALFGKLGADVLFWVKYKK